MEEFNEKKIRPELAQNSLQPKAIQKLLTHPVFDSEDIDDPDAIHQKIRLLKYYPALQGCMESRQFF